MLQSLAQISSVYLYYLCEYMCVHVCVHIHVCASAHMYVCMHVETRGQL